MTDAIARRRGLRRIQLAGGRQEGHHHPRERHAAGTLHLRGDRRVVGRRAAAGRRSERDREGHGRINVRRRRRRRRRLIGTGRADQRESDRDDRNNGPHGPSISEDHSGRNGPLVGVLLSRYFDGKPPPGDPADTRRLPTLGRSTGTYRHQSAPMTAARRLHEPVTFVNVLLNVFGIWQWRPQRQPVGTKWSPCSSRLTRFDGPPECFPVVDESPYSIDEIWEYIAGDSIDAADRVIADIFSTLSTLAESPQIGHRRPDLTTQPLRFHVLASVTAYSDSGTTERNGSAWKNRITSSVASSSIRPRQSRAIDLMCVVKTQLSGSHSSPCYGSQTKTSMAAPPTDRRRSAHARSASTIMIHVGSGGADPDVAWAELVSLAQGAAIASRAFWR